MIDPAHPENYPRRALMVVSGMSPQVITETVYALAVMQDPPWVPTELHVLTTLAGRERIDEALLGAGQGVFRRLRKAFGLRDLAFDADHVHVVTGADGQPLADIVSSADNAAMADMLIEQVRAFTGDEECALHMSLAGGRKTMSYYAGYALSLFGRAQDRLSHVLVDPGLERDRDFYFPDPGNPAHADAEVGLAMIPFVRLRDGLPARLFEGKVEFSEVVQAAQKVVEKPRAELVLGKHPTLRLGGEPVALGGTGLTFYLMLLRARQQDWTVLRGKGATAEDVRALRHRLWAAVQELDPDGVKPDADGYLPGFETGDMNPWRTRSNDAIKAALGVSAAQAYLVETVDSRKRNSSYRLSGIQPEDIHIHQDD